jgi:hypothetical protein
MKRSLAIGAGVLCGLLVLQGTAQAESGVANQPGAKKPGAFRVSDRCELSEADGVDATDARTAADIVCHELESRRIRPNSKFELVLKKLGTRTLLIFREHPASGSEPDEQRLYLSSIEELPALATQLADSLLVSSKRSEGSDSAAAFEPESAPGGERQPGTPRTPRTERFGAGIALVSATALGRAVVPSFGSELSFRFETSRFTILARGRAIGLGVFSSRLAGATFDVGGRFSLDVGKQALFVGIAPGLSYANLRTSEPNPRGGAALDASQSNWGGNVSAEFGVLLLRRERISVEFGLRFDFPLYSTSLGYPGALSLSAGLNFF